MVEFNPEWYKAFIESTNEKDLLVDKIAEILEGKPNISCLEIGLGISPHFARKLAPRFKKYVIVEKRLLEEKMPEGVELINEDWETVKLKEKFDAIIASHVAYYFKNQKNAINKMFDALSKKGRVIFVATADTEDYGKMKRMFHGMLGRKHKFTYHKILDIINGRKFYECTLPSEISFSSPEQLFEAVRIFFDDFPEEYEKNRNRIISFIKENVTDDKFKSEQKIIEVTSNPENPF